MARLADRSEANVDRSGDHDVWTGSKKADGTGKRKVDRRTVTAPRVAWELANGPLPAGAEVQSCPDLRACVGLDTSPCASGPWQAAGHSGRGRRRLGL